MKVHAALAALVLLAATTLSACGSKQTAQAPQPPKVSVATPLVKQIVDWDDYIGQFQAVQTVEIRPRVSGYLVKVHFDDGQRVKAGETLFTIDPRPFQAKLNEAKGQVGEVQATLANLRTQLARQEKLIAIKAVSQEELEATQAKVKAAEAQLTAAEAAVQSAELDVGFTEVKAPVDGKVSYRRVDVGNAVNADQTVLTTVTTVDPIRFVFQGSEAQYLRFKRQHPNGDIAGTPVRIKLQDEDSYDWKGSLDFLDTMVDTEFRHHPGPRRGAQSERIPGAGHVRPYAVAGLAAAPGHYDPGYRGCDAGRRARGLCRQSGRHGRREAGRARAAQRGPQGHPIGAFGRRPCDRERPAAGEARPEGRAHHDQDRGAEGRRHPR